MLSHIDCMTVVLTASKNFIIIIIIFSFFFHFQHKWYLSENIKLFMGVDIYLNGAVIVNSRLMPFTR